MKVIANMVETISIVLLCLVFSVFSCQICFGYEYNVHDDNYYSYEFEPKLDILFNMVMEKATGIIANKKPSFEVELTQEERYFSSDSMEFYKGTSLYEINEPPAYSGVKKLAVWIDGFTVIAGWTRNGLNYSINYVYTTDARFVLSNGISPRKSTIELEKFFNNNIYNISEELGKLGHVQAIWGNDDWSKKCVLICYSGTKIDSIEAWNNNVYGDAVPVVPSSTKVDNYISTAKRKIHEVDRKFQRYISEQRQMSLSEALEEIRNKNRSDVRRESKLTTQNNMGFVMFFLLMGILVSSLIIFIYYVVSGEKSGIYDNDTDANEASHEEEYINVEFTENTLDEEFDYPYEDIKEVL